jgi:hypothetical protein
MLVVTAQFAIPPSLGDSAVVVAHFASALEDPQPLIAQAAYDQISALPYSVLRGLARQMDTQALGQWTADARLRPRHPLYYLLWGFQQDAAIANLLEERLAAADSERTPAELSAMLAAWLEQRGADGLTWLEKRYLQDPATPDAQVQAALLALSVHGMQGGTRFSRDQVVAVYARFIEANPARAGFAASDLGTWERWEFADAFARALRSGANQVFASRYPMVFYLLRNPTAQGKAVLESLRSAGLL